MSSIDMNKPVWRVSGRLHTPDRLVFTCYVNASSEKEALIKARQEADFTISSAWKIDPLTGKPVEGVDIFEMHKTGCLQCQPDVGLCVIGASAKSRQEQRVPADSVASATDSVN